MEGVGTLVASRVLSLSSATTQARPLVTSRRTTTIASSVLRSPPLTSAQLSAHRRGGNWRPYWRHLEDYVSSALRSSAGRKLETLLEASGGDRLVTLLRGRPGPFARHPWRRIQEPLPIVRGHTPAKHRTSGASRGELAYFQLTPADSPRSLVVRRTHQEDSPRCSSRTAQLTHWLQQLRRRGSEKLLLDLIAAEDPTSPLTPALKHT